MISQKKPTWALTVALLVMPTLLWAQPADRLLGLNHAFPAGWSLQSSTTLSDQQTQAIASKWNVNVTKIANALVARGDQTIQINPIACQTEADAQAVASVLRRGKSNPRFVTQNGAFVFEFVVRNQSDAVMAIRARDALRIQPESMTYRISFQAVPIRDGDWMSMNRLFNALANSASGQATDQAVIKELASRFSLADELVLRKHGQGPEETRWSFTPEPAQMKSLGGDQIGFEFGELPQRSGLPMVAVSAVVNARRWGATSAGAETLDTCLSSTPVWPVDDLEIKQLAASITSDATGKKEKLQLIVKWMGSDQHVRFGGEIVGSRYGVKKTLTQQFGHCWDLSDVFITLCRASGIPARQVYGWLHPSSGHVWTEVSPDGKRWYAFDPSALLPCGSDYIPLATSHTGIMPFVYATIPKINVVPVASD